jgi:hypothetical protein
MGRTLECRRMAAIYFRQTNNGGFNIFQRSLNPFEGG